MAHKISYEQWKQMVDKFIIAKCGMHADDLDDWCYSSDYQAGKTPLQTANRAIRNAKEACGLM